MGAGATIQIKVAQLLELASVDLDAANTYAGLGGTGPSNQYPGGNRPYWRMTGATLVLDMEYKNFDVPGRDPFYTDHEDEMYCVLTVSHIGSWESMGSESINFQVPISYTSNASTGVKYYDTKLIDRYRQGINGVVLLGVATTIVTFVAKYITPCEHFGTISVSTKIPKFTQKPSSPGPLPWPQLR